MLHLLLWFRLLKMDASFSADGRYKALPKRGHVKKEIVSKLISSSFPCIKAKVLFGNGYFSSSAYSGSSKSASSSSSTSISPKTPSKFRQPPTPMNGRYK
ncbi:hypothetical protein KP509_05G085000 [Ceratopteris richardii]|uniref:Uncharacterized protein n=1 Tax=Ceratopteris richardii TaxID=49495 RepID=A0A8T2UNK9_CERRI|nr:hypothetical protein KP509_05G085000 [Ceratopteris richardii]